MSVIVNLVSNTTGTLKSFLDSFFEKDSNIDEDVVEWISIYNEPLEAIDIMTALIDNVEKYDIKLFISMDAGLYIEVTSENINDIIKFMFFRFYKDNSPL